MFDDKQILVTGGSGSFGKMFIRTLIARHKPRRVIVFSRDEFKQYEMSQDPAFAHPSIRFFIGDVRDKDRLFQALHDIDYVVHAAALKHVPAAEYNPFEAIKTNILGAQNVIDVALARGVRRVVALSTDKACNPVNLYGATKLCSDKLFVAGNAYSGAQDTRFAVVRYGNVVGSRGSVVPLFIRQRASGKVTITHPDMTRFWITLERGVDFVLSVFSRMTGGELFVPKIPSMRVVDLARAIAPDCKLETIGIRPGEKLHEVMISDDDARDTREAPDCYVVAPAVPTRRDVPTWGASLPLVPEGFRYSSDKNDTWLGVEELQTLAKGFEK